MNGLGFAAPTGSTTGLCRRGRFGKLVLVSLLPYGLVDPDLGLDQMVSRGSSGCRGELRARWSFWLLLKLDSRLQFTTGATARPRLTPSQLDLVPRVVRVVDGDV